MKGSLFLLGLTGFLLFVPGDGEAQDVVGAYRAGCTRRWAGRRCGERVSEAMRW